MDPARQRDISDTDPAINAASAGVISNVGSAIESKTSKSLPVVELTPSIYTQWIKPAADYTAALIAVLVFAIPMLIIAGVVLMSMGRPILFRQRRVGLHGQVFEVLKFRTMNADRRQNSVQVLRDHRVNHKSDLDPRHTPVGQFLRRFSLDELPQLINVLKGDMSVVGPRPELESVVSRHYSENLHRRHLVRPGLTGLWQISARGTGPMHQNGQWDLEYVRQISWQTDLKIVCKTPFAMFGRNRGH
ncbi:MAG: sugar transferase [Granulosicoccus sp.]|nr:sugar transferase [Granulosicoccus sp.]